MYFNFTTDLAANQGPPPTRAPLVLGVNSPLLAVVVLVVTSRIFVKAKLRTLAFEDALVVLSTVIIGVLLGLTSFARRYGFGMHVADIPLHWWPGYLKVCYAQIVVACLPYPLTKISMLIFYMRLTPNPTYRRICIATIAYTGISATVVTMLNLFGCSPISDGWNRSPGVRANCLNTRGYSYFYCSTSVVTDVILLVLPIPTLLRLQMNPRFKYGLVAMFATGILITSINAFGVYAMYATYISKDATWDGAYSWMWGMVEMNMAIIVACMPSMLLFAKWVLGEPTEDRSAQVAPHRGNNGAFGDAGGAPGRRAKKNHSETTTDLNTHLGSEEYIMQDLQGKSSGVVVVEVEEIGMSSGISRDGDGSSVC